jgi:hypothetical protein
LFAASSRVQSRLWLVTGHTSGSAPVISLVRFDVNCECYYYGLLLLLRCVWCVSSFHFLWFLLSHTFAAQLLANSCSLLHFAWTTGRRSARGIPVRLISCSRSPALANLTAQTGCCVQSNGLRRAINCKATSPSSVASSLLQQTQFFIALYSPESTHAAGSRWHFK